MILFMIMINDDSAIIAAAGQPGQAPAAANYLKSIINILVLSDGCVLHDIRVEVYHSGSSLVYACYNVLWSKFWT